LPAVLAGITSSFTSQIASHGAYAVFLLMLVDAVFPAASEIVMLYAGRCRGGSSGSAHHVSLFGAEIGYGLTAYVVMALAGTIGYLLSGPSSATRSALRRPAAARAPRTLGPPLAGQARPCRALVRPVGEPRGVSRPDHARDPLVRLDPGRDLPDAARALHRADRARLGDLGLRDRGAGYGLGSSERFHHDFRYAEYAILAGLLLLAAYLIYRWGKAGTVRRRDDPAR
jgi:hypothetical protein